MNPSMYFFAIISLSGALIALRHKKYLSTYYKKEDLVDNLRKVNNNLIFNFSFVGIVFLIIGLSTTIFPLIISESFSTFLSFSSGWHLALGNILLSLLVSFSFPIYLFLDWNRTRKIVFDYSKIDEFVSSLKEGEMVLWSTFLDKAKSLGLLVDLRPRLIVGLFIWIFALIAVNYLNTTIAMRLLRGYSWGPKPAFVAQQNQARSKSAASFPTTAETGIEEEIVSRSPSGKYWLRYYAGPNTVGYSSLELVTPLKPMILNDTRAAIVVPDSNRMEFTKKNVVWKNDESAFAFTYFTDVEATPRTPGYLTIISTTGNLIKMVDLGNASYYGNNVERPFYPVMSPDGKYIAVASDLIHQISVFDFMGNKIKDLPTKYSNVELFSPEMYALEGGKYSPFLDYKWSEDGKTILYRFEGTEKYFEVKL